METCVSHAAHITYNLIALAITAVAVATTWSARRIVSGLRPKE